MISFRFHLVSLIAVFLALGLGVLTGTTVINRGLVAQLEQQTADLARDFDEQRADLTQLQQQVETGSQFGLAVMPRLVEGRLAAQDVLVLAEDGADSDAVNGVQNALAEARADVLALLSVDDGLATLTEAQRTELAPAIGVEPDVDGEEFATAAGSALADRLAFGPDPGAPDPLVALMDEGYVGNQGPPLDDTALRQLAPDVFVVVGGGDDPAASPMMLSLVNALAETGSRVTAVEAAASTEPFVEELRNGDAADAVSTQDNVDQTFGEVGLVLGLEQMLSGGEPGHFGVKDGATSVIPPPA